MSEDFVFPPLSVYVRVRLLGRLSHILTDHAGAGVVVLNQRLRTVSRIREGKHQLCGSCGVSLERLAGYGK